MQRGCIARIYMYFTQKRKLIYFPNTYSEITYNVCLKNSSEGNKPSQSLLKLLLLLIDTNQNDLHILFVVFKTLSLYQYATVLFLLRWISAELCHSRRVFMCSFLTCACIILLTIIIRDISCLWYVIPL